MIKRAMAITIAVALVLAQSAVAEAFVTDKIYTNDPAHPGYVDDAFTATVDLSGGDPVATLIVSVKNVSDGTGASPIGWSGVNLGDDWKVSGQYLEVTYAANQIGWGVQTYTDNMSASANPQYSGDPTADPSQQPAGLIGGQNTLLTCPMVILVTDSAITVAEIQTPTLDPRSSGDNLFFNSGYDEIPGDDGVEKVWFWLKDKSGTRWNDDGDGVIEPGEIVSTFSSTGDDYATIVNTLGSSSGWVAQGTGQMQRDNSSSSPINVYVAADFSNANELQEYTTNTLTLELYHE